MFEVGWSEMLVIAVVLIVVVGPRDLPKVLRGFGRYAAQLRRMAGDFQRQVNDALQEAELDDVRRDIESIRRVHPASQVRSMLTDEGRKTEPAMEPLPQPAAAQTPALESPAGKVPKARTAKAKSAAAGPTPAGSRQKPAGQARKSAAGTGKPAAGSARARSTAARSRKPAKPATGKGGADA